MRHRSIGITRRTTIAEIVALSVTALTIAGCSTAQGTPEPDSPPAHPSRVTPDSTHPRSASSDQQIDPCELLTPNDADELGLVAKGPQGYDVRRECHWQKPANLSHGQTGYLLEIIVWTQTGVSQVPDNAGKKEQVTVNGRDVTQVVASGTCDMMFPLTKTSRLDVTIAGDLSPKKTCHLAKLYAKKIEPKLPK